MFCQQCTSHSTAEIKAAEPEREADIMRTEEGLQRGSDSSVGLLLDEKKLELSSLLQERVKGALVRSRFLQLRNMDGPSSLFFYLERSKAQRKLLTCLKLPGGRVTTDPAEIRSHAVKFYADLSRAEQCNMAYREEHLEFLPQLSEEEKTILGRELSLEELTALVEQFHLGKLLVSMDFRWTFLKDFGKYLDRTCLRSCWSVLDLVLLPAPVNELCFLCSKKREIWLYSRTGGQSPFFVQTTKYFPEPCLID